MGNFLERGFNPTQPSPEEQKKDDQAPDPDKRETLRKLFKIGAVAATASFVEPFLNVKDAFSQIESGEMGEAKNGFNYASLEAKEKLLGIERIFKAVELDKAASPIIIGTSDDFWRGLDELSRLIKNAIDQASGRITAAFAFTANNFLDKYPDLAKKLDLKSNYIYMIFNLENFDANDAARYAIHESVHAKHFADMAKKHPDDKMGLMRYPELSEQVNMSLEEIITCGETIDFYQKQIEKTNDNVLTELEKKGLLNMIESEKNYFLDNYLRYYLEKYPRDKFKFFSPPHGDQPDRYSSIDKIDQQVEKLYKKHNIIETVTRIARTIDAKAK